MFLGIVLLISNVNIVMFETLSAGFVGKCSH